MMDSTGGAPFVVAVVVAAKGLLEVLVAMAGDITEFLGCYQGITQSCDPLWRRGQCSVVPVMLWDTERNV